MASASVVAACLGSAWAGDSSTPASPDRTPAEPASALVGTWRIVSFLDDNIEQIRRIGGNAMADKANPKLWPRLVVSADRIAVYSPAGVRQVVPNAITNIHWLTYTSDGEAKDGACPIAIHAVATPSRNGGEPQPNLYRAIWKVDGDRLQIAWPENQKTRPDRFVSDGNINLLTCERLSAQSESIPDHAPRPAPAAGAEPLVK